MLSGKLSDSLCMFSKSRFESVFLPGVSVSGRKVKEFCFRVGRSVDLVSLGFRVSNGCVPGEHKF